MAEIPRLTAHRYTQERFRLGECPVWDSERSRWLFADLPSGEIFAFDERSSAADLVGSIGAPLGCFVPVDAYSYLVASERSVLLVGPTRHERVAVIPDRFNAYVRFNDGKIGPDGGLWVGIAASDGQASGGLVRCMPDGRVDVLLEGLHMPNGMAWDESAERFWLADSLRGVVTEYEWAGRQLEPVREVVSLPAEIGMPDGLSRDVSGALWIAIWGAAQVRRYTPDGELLAVVEGLPENPTSCAFGGPDGSTLVITSAGEFSQPDDRAGAVFACQLDVSGQATYAPGGFGEISSRRDE